MFSPDKWFTSSSTGFYSKTIGQSLRFNEGDSPVLSRTQTSGTTTTWTFSAWIKRSRTDGVLQSGGNAGQDPIFCVGDNNTNDMLIYFQQHGAGSTDCLDIIIRDSSSLRARLVTSRTFRDMSSWYHIQLTCDFTNSTQGDRLRLYVNGVRETAFSTETYPSDASQVTIVNNNSYTARLGQLRSDSSYFAGYMAEVHLVDGSALEPTSFGEFKNGHWTCKNYSGGHGTAGWFLPFDDGSAIGDDESANTNDFTATNLVASDVVPDSPTNNFATLNPLQNSGGGGSWYAQATLSEGNLKASLPANSVSCATMKATGKLYAEVRWSTVKNELALGLIIPEEYTTTTAHPTNTGANSWRMAYSGGAPADIFLVDEGTSVANPAQTVSAGDIFQVAWDTDSGEIWFGYNNSWYDSSGGTTGNPSTGANPTMTATTADLEASLVYIACGNNTGVGTINFGQDSTFAGAISAGGNSDANGLGDFKYTVPSGYKALCASNIPEPTIGPNSGDDQQTDDFFNTVLYTGNSGTNAITGVGFQPQLVWAKSRTVAYHHELYDVIRGSSRMYSSSTTGDSAGSITSFDSDGFTHQSGSVGTNANGDGIVAWNWKGGGSSNTFNVDGTGYSSASDAGLSGGDITPTAASINRTSGFGIIGYNGDGVSGGRTIKHGLSSPPEFIIIKDRDSNSNNNQWQASSSVIGDDYAYLSLTSAFTGAALMKPTSGDATTIDLGLGVTATTNESGDKFIMYCFHSVEGYSKVGKFTGNSSDINGTYVYTGFAPTFVMGKVTTQTGRWWMYDSVRSPRMNNTIGTGAYLHAQSTATESSDTGANAVQLLSNGFKVNSTNAEWNGSSHTYFYLAIGNTFKYANAR